MNEFILMATNYNYSKAIEDAAQILAWAYIISLFIILICIIKIASDIHKIMKVQTQPFQNKKPDYPDKVIELLQGIVSAEQHNTDEIHKLQQELAKNNNGGTVPGMKSTDAANQEQIITLLKQQNEILVKLLEATNGDEKKKLMEKWKQAQDIMNNM
jgi:hypothetical protein